MIGSRGLTQNNFENQCQSSQTQEASKALGNRNSSFQKDWGLEKQEALLKSLRLLNRTHSHRESLLQWGQKKLNPSWGASTKSLSLNHSNTTLLFPRPLNPIPTTWETLKKSYSKWDCKVGQEKKKTKEKQWMMMSSRYKEGRSTNLQISFTKSLQWVNHSLLQNQWTKINLGLEEPRLWSSNLRLYLPPK